METPVVLEPAKKHRTGPSGNIPQVEIAAMMQLPAAHNLAHRLGRFVANRRRETDEQIASAIHRLPGSKRKSQKIELLLWKTVQPVRILAVDNLRVNQRWIGTPDQHPKGAPSSYVSNAG